MAVVAAGELHDDVPPREAARERIADMVASVPELTRRTWSTGSTRATISSARATSFSDGCRTRSPVPQRCSRLQHVGVGVAEDHRTPEQMRSTYRLPSTSVSHGPARWP